MITKKMQKRGKLGILLILVLLALPLFSNLITAQDTPEDNQLTIYFFWGEGCPHCATEKPYLEEWKEKYPEIQVKSFETWKNPDNAKLFQEVAQVYGIQAQGVPTTFIGEKHWIGFSSSMAPEIEEYLENCIETKCEDKAKELFNNLNEQEESQENGEEIQNPELCIHVFLDGNCVQCQNIENYLEEINEKYNIQIKKYNVNGEENRSLFQEFKENYGLKADLYPTLFIGEKYIIGEQPIKTALQGEVEKCINEGCACPLSKVKPFTPITSKPEDVTSDEQQTVEIPLIGEVDLSSMSLVVVTALIAFVDGFNPCSLWVLTFLLGIVIYTRSRKKIFLVGTTFLLVTTLAYGLFMTGLVNVFSYVGYTFWIKLAVSLIALVFAVVNIKDYFWYKKGISFTISDKHKPKLFKKVRNIMDPNKSTLSMMIATALMALGIVLIELPCTAGFPMIWTNILAENNVVGGAFFSLLALYLIIYLIDELIVFTTATITLRASKFEEKHGRILKLVGGVIMLALAVSLIFFPDVMNSILGSIYVFGIAILVSFIIIWLHRKVLPKYGIKIGTEDLKNKTLNEDEKDVQENSEKENIKKHENKKDVQENSEKENIKKHENTNNSKEKKEND